MSEKRIGFFVLVSLLVTLLLSIIPLPDWLVWGRPQWVVLLVVYWLLEYPHRIGLVSAWLVGLLLDGLQGSAFGHNALALCVVAYLVLILCQRLRMFSLWKQAAVIFVLVGLHQLLSYWVQTISGRPAPELYFLFSCLASALIWPAFVVVMRSFHSTSR